MEVMINDTKVVVEKRNGTVVTIECYTAALAAEMAFKITMEVLENGSF